MRRRTFLLNTAAWVGASGLRRALAGEVPEYGPGTAYAPWRTWSDEAREGALGLVHAAVLSANAFNSQPWLFHVGGGVIDIYADTARNLGAFDPYLREMFFSLGCAIENLTVTAPANGFRVSWTPVAHALEPIPASPHPVLAARVHLIARKPATSALFDALPHRHTNREPFDTTRALPASLIGSLSQAAAAGPDVRVFFFSEEAARRALAKLIWDTSVRFTSDPEVQYGTRQWYRTTVDQWLRLSDGTYVGPPVGAARERHPLPYLDLMLTGRLFGVIAVRNRYDRAQTMRAGTVWQRLHLTATANGIAARPANGAVEIIDHERRLKLPPRTTEAIAAITRHPEWQPTFMFYMGYPTIDAVASPRRGLRDVVV